jgi:putative endonuclease
MTRRRRHKQASVEPDFCLAACYSPLLRIGGFLACRAKSKRCHSRESGNPGRTDATFVLFNRMSERTSWVYMMASQRNGTLYIGVTNDLARRAWEHRSGRGSQFTAKYRVTLLVWYEGYGDVQEAIRREKQLKGWERRWKLEMIEHMNPTWRDFYEDLNN